MGVFSWCYILLQEPRRYRVIHTGVEIIVPCFLVILVSCVFDIVADAACRFEYVAERVVIVACVDRISNRIHQSGYVGVAVVELNLYTLLIR